MFTSPTTFFRSSSSFNPPDLSGLALWNDAQDINSLIKNGGGAPSNNDPLQQVNDKSGNNINHSEPTLTLANMPLYVNNDLNGFPCVKFDGVNDFLRANFNAALGSSVFHFFCVSRLHNSASGATFHPTLYINSTTSTGVRFYIRDDGTTEIINILRRKVAAPFDILQGTTDVNTSVFIFEAEYTTQTIGRINGNLEATGPVGSYAPYTNGFSFLGSGSDTAGNPIFWSSISLGEVIFYNNIKSGADRTNIINYLKSKWGIA